MTKRWLYQSDGELKGPIPHAELKRLVREGVIGPATLVRREDGQKWTKAANVKGLLPSVKSEVPQASSEQSHTDRPNSFLEWYRTTKMAQLPTGGQIAVWLFYGFLWIPVLYAFSKDSDGHGRRKAVKTLWIIGGAFACFMLFCAILIPIIDPEGWKNIQEGKRRDGSLRHVNSRTSEPTGIDSEDDARKVKSDDETRRRSEMYRRMYDKTYKPDYYDSPSEGEKALRKAFQRIEERSGR